MNPLALSSASSPDSFDYPSHLSSKSSATVNQVRDLGYELTCLKVKHVALMSLWAVFKLFSYLSFTAPLASHFRKTAPVLCNYISTTLALVTGIYLFEKFITTLFPKYNDWVETQITRNRKKVNVLTKVYNRLEHDPRIPEEKSIIDFLNPWYTKSLRIYPADALNFQRAEELEAARESYDKIKKLLRKPNDVSTDDPAFYALNATKQAMDEDFYKFLMTDLLPDVLKVCQNRLIDEELIDPNHTEPKALESRSWHTTTTSDEHGIQFANLRFDEHAKTTQDRPFIRSFTKEGHKHYTYQQFFSQLQLCIENNSKIEVFIDHLYRELH
jgi:hypothetical protein